MIISVSRNVTKCSDFSANLTNTKLAGFGAFWVPQSPIGLISTEIGAPCRIPGHANDHSAVLIYSSHVQGPGQVGLYELPTTISPNKILGSRKLVKNLSN